MFHHCAVRLRAGIWAGIAVLFFGVTSVFAQEQNAQEHPGAASGVAKADGGKLFEDHCLSCHGPSGRATHQDALAKLTAEAIYHSLSIGEMKNEGAKLTENERRVVAEFLTGAEKTVVVPPLMCAGAAPEFRGSGQGLVWKGWSPDVENTRFQSAKMAGLTATEVKQLELRWALVIPNTPTLANQVTVVGDWLFLATQDGTIYALDSRTGCARWTYKASAGVRTAVLIEGSLVFFGDFEANVYAVDGRTGALRWKTKVEEHAIARITGAPTAYGGRLYVPVASMEEGLASNPMYACCRFRGSVVALDLVTGEQVWKTYTIAQPSMRQGVNAQGVEQWGPSGAAIWSAPTVDEKRGLLYVATGDNYSRPDSQTADSILALDLRNGAMRWQRAMRPSDVWNVGCLVKNANCPENAGPDYDFGSSPVLVRRAGGHDMILAGQKSGVLFALDPQRRGKLLWELQVGKGGELGGILWGFATDGKRAYVSITDQNIGSYEADGALNAVDLATGKLLWRTANPAATCKDRPKGCSNAMAAPVTAMPGVVFVGSLDGHLRAYDAGSGSVLWDFDAVRDITGVNGMVGQGGSMSAAGVTLANGFVYQTAGYGYYGMGMAGNVLMAFAPAGPR